MNISVEVLVGIVIAVIGSAGSFVVARINANATRNSDLTDRFDRLLDGQGKEIARLSTEVDALRADFKEEQQLTETLKEESTRWRGLLQQALVYLRRIQTWETAGHPPPPPPFPPELMDWLWEDL